MRDRIASRRSIALLWGLALLCTLACEDPSGRDRLFAGCPAGAERTNTMYLVANYILEVVQTTDRGESWSRLFYWDNAQRLNGGMSIAMNPADAAVLLVGATDGIRRTTDAGRTWRKLAADIYNVSALAFSPADPSIAYAASWGWGIWKSTDGGETFFDVNRSIADPRFYSLALDPTTEETVYAGSEQQGIAKSTDGGATWRFVDVGLNEAILDIALRPDDPRILFAATAGNRVMRSTDGGETWKPSGDTISGTHVSDISFDPEDPETMYGVTFFDTRQIVKSIDGGETWHQVYRREHGGGGWIEVDPLDSCTIYADMSGQVLRSTDGGRAWALLKDAPEPEGNGWGGGIVLVP